MKDAPENDIDAGFDFDARILTPGPGETVRPVQTIPLNEFKFRDFCQENEIICYLPLTKKWRLTEYVKQGKHYRYSKVILRPMFCGYVFVRIDNEQRSLLWASHRVARILTPSSQEHFLMELRAVHAFEMTALGQKVEFNVEVQEREPFIIENGLWAGVTGWLEKKEKRFEWSVWLEFANQYVRTTINPAAMRMRRLEPDQVKGKPKIL